MTATPYEVVVSLAAELTGTEILDELDECEPTTISDFVERNRSVLESARNVLGPQCAVPVRYEQSFFVDHADHLTHLRCLARAFRAEAMLASSREDGQAAARIGIGIFDLANATRRGGLVVDMLVGMATSGIAIWVLRTMRANFDRATRRMLIEQLERIECECEPLADVVARDRDWEAATGYEEQPCDDTPWEFLDPEECGLSEEEQREAFELVQQVAELTEADRQQMYVELDDRGVALMRMLVIDLALREYCDSFGALPERLSELSPHVLPKLPRDPFTQQSFVYRPAADGSFSLYSPGPLVRDHGGRFGSWCDVACGHADLCLDVDEYP